MAYISHIQYMPSNSGMMQVLSGPKLKILG